MRHPGNLSHATYFFCDDILLDCLHRFFGTCSNPVQEAALPMRTHRPSRVPSRDPFVVDVSGHHAQKVKLSRVRSSHDQKESGTRSASVKVVGEL